MGRNNTPKGTSTSTGVNGDDPLAIVGNGSSPVARSNAFEISNNGHAIAMHENGNGGPPVYIGGHYNDNMTVAWSDVPYRPFVNPALIPPVDEFGVASINHTGTGTYVITLKTVDANGNTYLLNRGAVTVTLQEDSTHPAPTCAFVTSSRIVNGSFTVRIRDRQNCVPVDAPFFFKVVGRQ